MATTGQNIRAKWLSNTRKKYYLFNAEHRELMGIFVHFELLPLSSRLKREILKK